MIRGCEVYNQPSKSGASAGREANSLVRDRGKVGVEMKKVRELLEGSKGVSSIGLISRGMMMDATMREGLMVSCCPESRGLPRGFIMYGLEGTRVVSLVRWRLLACQDLRVAKSHLSV